MTNIKNMEKVSKVMLSVSETSLIVRFFGQALRMTVIYRFFAALRMTLQFFRQPQFSDFRGG